MSSINFEEDQAKVITKTDNIQSLADQVERLENLNQEVKKDEEDLKQKKKNLEHISGEVIPTMMAEMGLAHLKLMDGSSGDVKPHYSANITIANKDAAFKWLRDNGHGDLIKNQVSATFGKGEDSSANEFIDKINSLGYEPTQKVWVEPMTLKAFVREQITEGSELPMDTFGVFVGAETKISKK